MSEPVPEPGGGGGNFLTRKILGLPVFVWALLAIVIAYFYFRSRGGSSGIAGSNPVSSANNGTATTGDTTFPSDPLNITVNSQYSQTGKASSTAGNPPPRHTTKNPQPTPKTKPPVKKHVVSHKPPAKPVHK